MRDKKTKRWKRSVDALLLSHPDKLSITISLYLIIYNTAGHNKHLFIQPTIYQTDDFLSCLFRERKDTSFV